MAGEIMCKVAEVVNIIGAFNAICICLENVENDLNGIEADASSLGLTNLNISQVQENINSNKEKIKNMMQFIKSLLEGFINAEEKNIEIVDKLYEIGTGILDGISIATSGFKFLQNLITEVEVKITGKGFELWKDNVQYNIKSERINGHRCFILEPENADSNIPTVFILDGDGASAVSNIKDIPENDQIIIDAIGSIEGGGNKFTEKGRQSIPLTGINYGGLEKPQARFIYLPNNGTPWRNTDYTVFKGIVDHFVSEYNIDTDKMTILGHSSRGICSSKICISNCRRICK